MAETQVGRTVVRNGEIFDVDGNDWQLDVDGVRFGPFDAEQGAASAYRKMRKGLSELASVKVYKNNVFHHTIR